MERDLEVTNLILSRLCLVFAMREFPFPLFPVSRTFLATGIPVREYSNFPPPKQGNEVLKDGSDSDELDSEL